jgi:phage baseplate assembly protein W
MSGERPVDPVSGPDSFLGRGWAFPPRFTPSAGTAEMVSGLADIEQSLGILLRTGIGERLMRPDYGCDLTDLLFEPVDAALVARVEDRVKTAILYHEPRIDLLGLEMTALDQGATVILTLTYRVRATNSRHNFVIPYNQLEATLPAP